MKKRPNSLTSFYIGSICGALGGIILFVSWISQNYFSQHWNSEIRYLENTQSMIVAESGLSTQWQIALNGELNRVPRNENLLRAAALMFVQKTANILAWLEARVADTDEQNLFPLAVKELVKQRAADLYSKNQTEDLLSLCKTMAEASDKFTANLNGEFIQKLTTARAKAASWNRIFLVAYVLGTALLAVAFMCSWLRERQRLLNP